MCLKGVLEGLAGAWLLKVTVKSQPLANMSKGMDAKPPAYGLTSKAAGLHIDS
jgi:hypothetical protein